MKNILYIFCLLLIVIGCKKNGVQPKGYLGTWELKQETGTIAGTTKTYPSGEGHLLLLNTDSTYQSFSDFQHSVKGTFKIVKNGVTWAGKTYDAIYFDNKTPADYIILNGYELTIGNTFPDGVTSVYERRN